MQSQHPEDHYPQYMRDMLQRAGLLDAESLAERLPDWTEEELRAAFSPAYRAIRDRAIEVVITESLVGLDGGEQALRIDGLPILISQDNWMFDVFAGPELLDRLVESMRPLRA